MAEKKTTKAVSTKTAATKKTTSVKTATKKVVVSYNAVNVGFKAGDVYEALAAEKKALSVKEIAKVANMAEEEVLLGAGWLLKEGKITESEGKIVLA